MPITVRYVAWTTSKGDEAVTQKCNEMDSRGYNLFRVVVLRPAEPFSSAPVGGPTTQALTQYIFEAKKPDG